MSNYNRDAVVERMRKFHVTVFRADDRTRVQEERQVSAVNMYEARKMFLDRGIEAHRIYCLDITK